MEMKLEEVTLGTLVEGRLEREFQSRVAEMLASVVAELDQFQTKGDRVEVGIDMKVLFVLDPNSLTDTMVYASADLKLPKRIVRGGAAYLRSGKVLVPDHAQEQLPLLNRAGQTPADGEKK